MSLLDLFRPKDLEPVASDYLERTRHKPKRKTQLRSLTPVVLDAETTGFDVGIDRLLSIATVEVQDREMVVESSRQWLVYQSEAAANEAVSVHGILPSETASGRPEREVMAELLPLLAGRLIVGHHIGFDMKMLSHAAHAHFRIRLHNMVVDTALLAMQEMEAFKQTGYPNQRPPSLDDVCSQLNIPAHERHTAGGDAFTTAEVFLILCGRLRQRLGRPVELRDLGSARLHL